MKANEAKWTLEQMARTANDEEATALLYAARLIGMQEEKSGWQDFSKVKPKRDGKYLVMYKTGYVTTANYDAGEKRFMVKKEVVNWCFIPEFYK